MGLILLLFGVGYFSFKSANLIDTTSNSLVALTILLKPFALTIAFLGLLTYYPRWMNRWFDRHADAEFQLRKLSLDVDRASWVIESALEWRSGTNSVLPKILLESITRNLFTNGNAQQEDLHPADYLASAILGSARNIKLGLPGTEIEFSGSALKKAKIPSIPKTPDGS